MSQFAVMNDNNVVNIIVAESKEVAENITNSACIEYFDDKPAFIGGTWDGADFIKPQPFASWVLDANKEWQAPVQQPADFNEVSYLWNEATLTWDIAPE